MNIFATHTIPSQCAGDLDDLRLRKMIVETAQLLCGVTHACDTIAALPFAPIEPTPLFYKSTHLHHPCAKWTRQSRENYDWLRQYFTALCDVYTVRFIRLHLTDAKLRDCFALHTAPIPMDDDSFCDCTPYQETEGTVVQHYRQTMVDKWHRDAQRGRPPKWTGSSHPDWTDAPWRDTRPFFGWPSGWPTTP